MPPTALIEPALGFVIWCKPPKGLLETAPADRDVERTGHAIRGHAFHDLNDVRCGFEAVDKGKNFPVNFTVGVSQPDHRQGRCAAHAARKNRINEQTIRTKRQPARTIGLPATLPRGLHLAVKVVELEASVMRHGVDRQKLKDEQNGYDRSNDMTKVHPQKNYSPAIGTTFSGVSSFIGGSAARSKVALLSPFSAALRRPVRERPWPASAPLDLEQALASTRPKRSSRGATRAVHPVWWLAPRPAPLSPWKYS